MTSLALLPAAHAKQTSAGAHLACPQSLRPDSGSPRSVIAAVHKAAPKFLRGHGERRYHLVYLASLYPYENMYVNAAYTREAKSACGAKVAFHSWVVVAVFPYWVKRNTSAARSQAVLFVAHTTHGWVVWDGGT